MRLFITYLRTIITSFYSPVTYKDVRYNWRGFGARYLALICILCTIPIGYFLSQSVDRFLAPPSDDPSAIPYNVEYIIEQIPELTFFKNKLSTPEEGTFLIKSDGSDEPIMVIDTTGMLKFANQTPAHILITTDYVSYISPFSEEEIFAYEKIFRELKIDQSKKKIITRDDLIELAQDAITNKGTITSYLIVIFASVTFFNNGLSVILLACFGLLMSSFLRTQISFMCALRLSAVAATPTIIVKTIEVSVGGIFSNPSIIYFLMHFAYLLYAIDCSRER